MANMYRNCEGYVYRIYSKRTDKNYVGSALKAEDRWKEHQNELKQGVHHSITLQCAYGLYGLENLEFIILEKGHFEWDNDLRLRESYWMEKCNTLFPFGYNMTKRTKLIHCPNATPRKIFRIRDPEGNIHEAEGLIEFCEKQGLEKGVVSSMLRGQRVYQHRGWKPVGFPEGYKLSPVTPRQPSKRRRLQRKPRGINKKSLKPKKFHRFYSPSGELIEVPHSKKYTLKNWCEDRNLDYKKLSHVVHGFSKNYLGYTPHETKMREQSRPLYVFKNPEGNEVLISNLEGYCKKHGLSATAMFELVRGAYKTRAGHFAPKTEYKNWSFVEKLKNYFSGFLDEEITREKYNKIKDSQTPISS